MAELSVAIGWFAAFCVVSAVIGALIWQMQPRTADKAQHSPPAHH